MSNYDSFLMCPKCKRKIDEVDFSKKVCNCGFRLRIHFNYEHIKEKISKSILFKRPFNHDRYLEFFPLKSNLKSLDFGIGGTPLVKSKRIAKKLGLKNLFFKLENQNPSGSFKDRPISIGIAKANELGTKVISAASSGNAAAALATFGAKINMKVVVFVPEEAPLSKLAQLIHLGAHVIRIKSITDNVDDTIQIFKKVCNLRDWTPCPSFGPFNPFQFEGTKSLSFEICEQLDYVVPDWILCPTGSGGLLSGIYKGFKDFSKLDFISKTPKMVAVQPNQCCPIVDCFKKKIDPLNFMKWEAKINTIAGGLADPYPWDGDSALEALYASKGKAIKVSESDIIRTHKECAQFEGIFGEPSGTTALAGLEHLVFDGTIDHNDLIVIPITGSGFKDLNFIMDNSVIDVPIKPTLTELNRRISTF